MYPHWDRKIETEADGYQALVALARYLRGPDGCPWDRRQRVEDFARFALEEANELVQACTNKKNDKIAEEWGDVFFVLLAAAIAAEQEGVFSIKDALKQAHNKMIRRHEHVFGSRKAETAEEAVARWNDSKARERDQA